MADPSSPPPRVLLVVAPERFRDEEALEPKRALEAARVHVAVASTRLGKARGMLGAVLEPSLLVSQARAADYDAIAVVGGTGAPDHLWAHEPLLALVREMFAAGKAVGGICFSGAVLARAGVLSGRRATVFPTPRTLVELRRGGAAYVGERVVVDGTVVTASGPEAAQEFAAALLQQVRP